MAIKSNESKKALFIGIDDYDNPRAKLRACINDAKAMCELLTTHGNGDPNFTPRDTRFTLNLTNARIKTEIERLLQPNRAPEHALLYFSGHGRIDKTGGYFVGKDYSEEDKGVSMDWLVDQLNDSLIPEITVILDCCFAGGFTTQSSGKLPLSRLRENVTILAATTRNDVASEGPQHGAFTKILIQGLEGAAADTFGRITAAGLYNLVDSAFSPWEQRPVFMAFQTKMKPLRRAMPILSDSQLRDLKSRRFFHSNDRIISLLPKDIVTDSSQLPETKFLTQLIHFQRIGLVGCEDQLSVYEAALHSKSCWLSPLGKFFINQIEQRKF